ncbi:hypothetical protein AK812_SmicGene36928 [Symbiodinium microadriaticum]|uniref:Uncharacterized protein n=1 Tax=Symbiodinium microadriaticum TaxID=2951 RepID=A0A1Q9CHL3_SYMMI|nr:hypothetical protein AK812_SmicGene36928 [Symbiodinium microadriaticum]
MAPAVPSLRVQQLEKLQRRQSFELEQMLLNASKESSRRTPRPCSARAKATTAGVCRSGGERRGGGGDGGVLERSPSPRQRDRSADVPPEEMPQQLRLNIIVITSKACHKPIVMPSLMDQQWIAGVGSVALACHLHATCGGHWCGVSQALGKGTTSDQPPLSESEITRLEEDLVQVRIQMFKKLSRVLVHCAFFIVLVFVVEFAMEPNTYSATLLALAVSTYVIYHLVNTGRVEVTDQFLRPLCPVLNGIIMTALVASAYVSQTERDYMARFGLCSGAQILMGVVFGPKRFLGQQAFQAAIGIMLPGFVEFALRERIVASIRSKDADSLIFGFRQMLKGICDGEVLLDSQLRIFGNTECLQRLLETKKDFRGCPLQELIDGDDDVENFEKFVSASLEEPGADRSESEPSAPRCLRVPLKSPAGRIVKVDVCHVLLPQLYGRKELHHLLSLTEDTESRQPEALPMKHAEAQLEVLRQVRGAYPASQSAGSVSSCETFIESFEELAEMTLVLNGSTELIDIEEAHFKFHRQSSAQKLGLGMPTLKRFARPLDWQGFSSFLRRYSRQVAKGKSPAEQSMNGITLRLPSDSRKHLIARQGTLSSPFVRNEPSDPVHLILQLSDFRGERPQEVHPRLEGVDELQSSPSRQSRKSQERLPRFAAVDEAGTWQRVELMERWDDHENIAQEIFMALDSLPTATAAASHSVKAAKEGFLRLFSELATVQGRLETQLKLKQELHGLID